MTDKEVMQMALDALESLQAWPETSENFKRVQAIEALRAALAQPKREWVGLTDEEIRNIATHGRTDFSRPPYEEYYIAIEQALKEKNT